MHPVTALGFNGDGCVTQAQSGNDKVQFVENGSFSLSEDEGDGEDACIDVPWLTDNKDEEAQYVRDKVRRFIKGKKVVEDDTVDSLSPDLITVNEGTQFEKDSSEENAKFDADSDVSLDSNDDVSFVSTDDDDDKAEHARRRKAQHKVYKEVGPRDMPKFELGMIFQNRDEFKNDVLQHAMAVKRNVTLSKNDTRRVVAKCKDKSCKWKMHVSLDSKTDSWMVKTYVPEHTCPLSYKNNRCFARHLAKYYIKTRGISALSLNNKAIVDNTKEELHITIKKTKARRIRDMIRLHFQGDFRVEFARLEDYVHELRIKNPGSTIILETKRGSFDKNRVFKRMYVCFAGLRDGFLAGCRHALGVDGAFLKGPCKGELLSAVGRDANNQMFPVAWAIVDVENTESWSWFLGLLSKDLRMGKGETYTILSDQQKGLINAIAAHLPNAEHRRCARHIYANFRKFHRGKDLQMLFGACAKSTTIAFFNENLEKIGVIDPAAKEYLLKIDPKFWCKAFFKIECKVDSVDNNMCETFNGIIIEARHKSFIAMNDDLRRMLMNRIEGRREYADKKFKDDFGPKIWEKIEENKFLSAYCHVEGQSTFEYEIREDNDNYVVDVQLHKCTCRRWDLTGIPCRHAVAAIQKRNEKIEDYVSSCYSKSKFMAAYSFDVFPAQSMKFWECTGLPPIDPPIERRMPGRPKKKRILEDWEVGKGTKLGQKGKKMTCQACFKRGHNSRTYEFNGSSSSAQPHSNDRLGEAEGEMDNFDKIMM